MAERKHNEAASTGGTTPFDLEHLARQTLGDERLRRDVLELFVEEAAAVRENVSQADAAERRLLAHRLCGSARAVGAFALAAGAAELENSPQSDAAVGRLLLLIEEAMAFIVEQML